MFNVVRCSFDTQSRRRSCWIFINRLDTKKRQTQRGIRLKQPIGKENNNKIETDFTAHLNEHRMRNKNTINYFNLIVANDQY